MSYEDHWMDKDKELNDFGFSFDSPEEKTRASDLDEALKRVDEMYKAIMPLLDNLATNPEKDTIYWPNRKEKIEAFKQKLKAIRWGEQDES